MWYDESTINISAFHRRAITPIRHKNAHLNQSKIKWCSLETIRFVFHFIQPKRQSKILKRDDKNSNKLYLDIGQPNSNRWILFAAIAITIRYSLAKMLFLEAVSPYDTYHTSSLKQIITIIFPRYIYIFILSIAKNLCVKFFNKLLK